MLNTTTTIAEAVGTKLAATYRHYYGDEEARFATILDAGARLIIERISTSDALYHNVEHTILVTERRSLSQCRKYDPRDPRGARHPKGQVAAPGGPAF